MGVIGRFKCLFGHQWKYIGLNELDPRFANIECVRCSASDSRWILPDDILGYDQEEVLKEYYSRQSTDPPSYVADG